MMREINYDLYLQRIGAYTRPLPVLDSLILLQRQHLLRVPFENIDIYHRVPVILSPDAIYAKIVERGRGGYCYECNGLFHLLLQWLGFNSRMISCRVITGKNIGAAYDHMALIVTIDDTEWLVDVGFGHFAATPLLLGTDMIQEDGYGSYSIRQDTNIDGQVYLSAHRQQPGRADWLPIYAFTTGGHSLDAFLDMHHYHRTAPDSHFIKNLICSRLTETGRLSLLNNRLIATNKAIKEDRLVYGYAALTDVLANEFGIHNALPESAKTQ